ncbi:hypothetical protein TNCV_1083641 [Trichonephila clavipes]|nr:hypothetical protein TNCV_1083641 [Trichonephila clavipes]
MIEAYEGHPFMVGHGHVVYPIRVSVRRGKPSATRTGVRRKPQRILAAEVDFENVPRIMVDCSAFLIASPSSYLAECGFSAVATLVTKKRPAPCY